MKKFIFPFISLLFLYVSSFSQHYYFDNYSVKEGLAQSKIYDIAQDKEGYIWAGTESGVSKFDGINFINYTSDEGLAENGVRTIFIDSQEKIWFGHTGGGISIYNGNIFQKLELDSIAIEGDVTSIMEDKKQRIWIGTHGDGAFLIKNPFTDTISNFNIANFSGKEKLSDRIFAMYNSSKDVNYFVIDGSVKYFDEEKNTFEFYSPEGLPRYFQLTCMYEDKDENMWFGSFNGGLYKQNIRENTFRIYDQIRDGLADNWITTINGDKEGAIWVGTWEGGITRIKNGNLKNFNISNGLLENKIRKIIEDREGNIIIGTHENGLAIFKGEQFVSYSKKDDLVNEQVNTILQSGNKIWFGTKEGISILDREVNPNQMEQFGGKNSNYAKNNFNKEIVFLKEDKNNNIWIGTKTEGIYVYIPSRRKIEYYPMLNIMLNQCTGIITAMEIDNNNNLWIGTIDGLIYYEIQNQAMDRLTTVHGLAGTDISALYCDNNGNIWVGSKGKGVTKIEGTNFIKMEEWGSFTPKTFVEGNDNRIWIGTEGQGLYLYNNDNSITKFKVKDGLLANLVTALQVDNNGAIWIGTNKGLNKYVKEENKFYTYTERTGFTGIEVKNNAVFKDNNGILWFGTVKGAFKFNPEKEKVNTLEPLTHINKLRVNLKERPIIQNTRFSYREKNIIIDYNSICFTDPDRVNYQVMLEGADEDWQPVTKQTYKTYSPLPPGKYTFKVRATNNNGIWNSEPAKYKFTIRPPFYYTWWFITICVVVITIAIVSYVQARERQLRKEKIILEEKVQERTKEIQEKNNLLAKKNKNIMDSIRYAKRIQEAMLPSPKQLKERLTNSFILFKPKDIVSGDFYWLDKRDDKVMFAAVDCTGHGVPGAFMSIVGHNGLHRAVSEFNLRNPGDIMDKLNELVEETLQSTENQEVKDGMDMALCVLDRKTNILEYSGANNPLYVVRPKGKKLNEGDVEYNVVLEGETHDLFEIKANKQPIGAYFDRKNFVSHRFQLEEGDAIYVFSDGFADQFGGPKGRKYMYKPFKRQLLAIQDKKMTDQRTIMNSEIENWMKDYEQIDDICLVGVKV
jgi:ligand-binding sensor domain-containing protein/serine phosphatase RsbU (regulator of sigma subunit)